ncbi:glycosyltransferase family 4 protein [Candidatus Halobonum tyrrellensis]|uniref:Glycosyltransferase n=1 Tax=Candidatus Halobonum tyrrellensis G22 TaxID=1324957 RepID=V4HM75_9EURY|nr:glycosyltransferase family 4 protein [Candidatus Halobonum tyrrellensis]ESP89029.1 glycosyltransferase [Candidatus Halobonum tyrrellensis G22]
MRVLLVTHRYPPQTGGVETHVRELAERLVARDHRVTVFAADADHAGSRRERRAGVRVRRFRSFHPGEAFYAAPGVLPAVRRADADVVHAHNYHALPAATAALAVGSRPLVFTPHYHGASASSVRDRLLSVYRPFAARAVRRADAVLAVSEWERRQLRADLGVESGVVPNGLDVARFAGATPESRDRPYLLCVGRLEEYKGVQHAVGALASLPGYDLVVAGSGPYRDELERTARAAGVADRVTFAGYVDADRLPGLYAGAEAALTLSAFEAYGMTVAESLAAGTPCVVRAAAALSDWRDTDGVVAVDATDPETVADAVRAAVGSGVVPPESLPTWEGTVDSVEATYERVAGR